MCGIVGMVGHVDEVSIRRMTQSLFHRGPDDGGFWISEDLGVGLGHRRLSILDLSIEGRQPMFSDDGRYIITYNGEVFNYALLRAELQKIGFSFHSRTDTEVVLKGFQAWGKDVLKKMHGQFAFCIWDRQDKIFFAARDRFGIKPLYYFHNHSTLAVSSEIKALLYHQDIKGKLNESVLPQYLAFLWTPGPKTLFENILKLMPGHFIEFQNGELRITKYWDLEFRENYELHKEELRTRMRTALDDAVQSQLISDVPIGLLLSGGLDSTCLLSSLRTQSNEITSFIASYKPTDRSADLFDDDLPYAMEASKYFEIKPKQILLEHEVARLIDKIIWHLDEPLADPSVITNYVICREARGTATVLLSGMGADEILGGYPRYIATMKLKANLALRVAIYSLYPLIRNIGSSRGKVGGILRRLKTLGKNAQLPFEDMFLEFSTYFSSIEQKALLSDGYWEFIDRDTIYEQHRNHLEDSHHYSLLNRMLYTDVKTFLPCLNLENMDKTSMAHSVEMRVPFLDEKFVQFCSSIPSVFKIRGSIRKYILREAFDGLIPNSIISRPKTGFSVPIRKWIRDDLFELIADTIFSTRFKARGIFNQKEIETLYHMNQKGIQDNSLKLWQLIVFDLWMKTFIESSLPSILHDPNELVMIQSPTEIPA